MRVESEELYIEKVGDTLVIKPKTKEKWETFFEIDTDDFLEDRKQLPVQERKLF